MGAAINNKLLTVGVCAFILFSIHPQLENPDTCLFRILSVLYLSYWVGSSFVKSVCILYFILNSSDVMHIISQSHYILMQSAIYSTKLPVFTSISPGRSIYRSFQKKSVQPLAIACAARILFEIADIVENTGQKAEKGVVLTSSSVVNLYSNSVYMHTGSGYYGKYKGKQGSGNRWVVANKIKPVNSGWKILLEGLEGNPLPMVRITSGSVIYLQDVQTGEYLQTSDVASPLTACNQEVSTGKEMSEASKFIIINEDGSIGKSDPVYSDGHFYLKHVNTGVFVRVLKRRIKGKSSGYEVNGEKETGVNKNIGSKSSLWTVLAAERAPTGVAEIICAFVSKVYNGFCLKLKRVGNIGGTDKKKNTVKKFKIYQYVYSLKTIMYAVAFGLAMVRGLLGAEHILEKTISCTLDLLIGIIFRQNIRNTVLCAGVIGIRHGLKVQNIIKEVAKKKSSEKRK